MSLADALEEAAGALPALADEIRPANGDPFQLLDTLDDGAAAQLLAWLLASSPDDAAELADAWAEEEEGMAIVLAASEDGLPKAGKKVLRRLRHRLRSAGVAVQEEAPPPVVARVAPVESRLEGAWVSPFDPMGARFVYQLEPHPQGGARLFECVIDDARGLVGFEVYSASRSKIRQFLRDLGRRDAFPAIEVAPPVARTLVARAVAGSPTDRPLPRNFSEWRTRVAEDDPGIALPGDEVAAALAPGEAMLEDATARIEAGEFGPWPPEGEVLMPLVEKLRAAADSPLIVSGATRQEQLATIVAEAVDEVFDAEWRALARHRFRESAWTFWKRGDEDAARACLAAAVSFEGEGSLSENPVARILLELPLRPVLEGEASTEGAPGVASDDESEPLIVTP